MKVALLKPPIGGILGLEMLTFVEPLGLLAVAACLERAGHECRIFDLRLDGLERGLGLCRDFAPEVVGLQCNFTTERRRALSLARRVRALLPAAFVVVGGHDASRDPEWFADPAFDAVAIGDGEEVLPPLVAALAAGRPVEDLPGLRLALGGQWTTTPPVPHGRDLDAYPPPARHLVARYAPDYYINFRRPLALLETARGCPFHCNFCSVWKFHESSFRQKSPARVVEELRAIAAPNVFVTDDIFWLDVRRGEELARQVQRAGIRKYFTVQTRTDIICKFPHLVEMWKGCGPLAIFLGLEAIDDRGLDAVHKKNSAANNERAIEILKGLGVGFTPNFIVDPDWDHQDFARLRDWIERMGAFNSGFSVLTPLPGTDLWNDARERLTTDDWEMFDIVHAVLPTRLPLDEFYAEYSGLWRHVLDLRYRLRGRTRTYLALAAALASGQVRWNAVRKGMNIARVFGRPETFLAAHRRTIADLG